MRGNTAGTGLRRELVIYVTVGIVPFAAVMLVMIFSPAVGLYMLLAVFALEAFAAGRLGLFLDLEARQWLLLGALFLAAYAPSFPYMFYRSYRYSQEPHPPESDEDGYLPKGHSVVLDWSQPHGHGAGD
jgi:ABC-type nickel/cobalt efflux system permease component RcnA